jgi:hypothetical protein
MTIWSYSTTTVNRDAPSTLVLMRAGIEHAVVGDSSRRARQDMHRDVAFPKPVIHKKHGKRLFVANSGRFKKPPRVCPPPIRAYRSAS